MQRCRSILEVPTTTLTLTLTLTKKKKKKKKEKKKNRFRIIEAVGRTESSMKSAIRETNGSAGQGGDSPIPTKGREPLKSYRR
jgi:hypothetical protein